MRENSFFWSLNKFSIEQRCVDVDTMIEMYERFVSELLGKHVPLKKYKGCGYILP